MEFPSSIFRKASRSEAKLDSSSPCFCACEGDANSLRAAVEDEFISPFLESLVSFAKGLSCLSAKHRLPQFCVGGEASLEEAAAPRSSGAEALSLFCDLLACSKSSLARLQLPLQLQIPGVSERAAEKTAGSCVAGVASKAKDKQLIFPVGDILSFRFAHQKLQMQFVSLATQSKREGERGRDALGAGDGATCVCCFSLYLRDGGDLDFYPNWHAAVSCFCLCRTLHHGLDAASTFSCLSRLFRLAARLRQSSVLYSSFLLLLASCEGSKSDPVVKTLASMWELCDEADSLLRASGARQNSSFSGNASQVPLECQSLLSAGAKAKVVEGCSSKTLPREFSWRGRWRKNSIKSAKVDDSINSPNTSNAVSCMEKDFRIDGVTSPICEGFEGNLSSGVGCGDSSDAFSLDGKNRLRDSFSGESSQSSEHPTAKPAKAASAFKDWLRSASRSLTGGFSSKLSGAGDRRQSSLACSELGQGLSSAFFSTRLAVANECTVKNASSAECVAYVRGFLAGLLPFLLWSYLTRCLLHAESLPLPHVLSAVLRTLSASAPPALQTFSGDSAKQTEASCSSTANFVSSYPDEKHDNISGLESFLMLVATSLEPTKKTQRTSTRLRSQPIGALCATDASSVCGIFFDSFGMERSSRCLDFDVDAAGPCAARKSSFLKTLRFVGGRTVPSALSLQQRRSLAFLNSLTGVDFMQRGNSLRQNLVSGRNLAGRAGRARPGVFFLRRKTILKRTFRRRRASKEMEGLADDDRGSFPASGGMTDLFLSSDFGLSAASGGLSRISLRKEDSLTGDSMNWRVVQELVARGLNVFSTLGSACATLEEGVSTHCATAMADAGQEDLLEKEKATCNLEKCCARERRVQDLLDFQQKTLFSVDSHNALLLAGLAEAVSATDGFVPLSFSHLVPQTIADHVKKRRCIDDPLPSAQSRVTKALRCTDAALAASEKDMVFCSKRLESLLEMEVDPLLTGRPRVPVNEQLLLQVTSSVGALVAFSSKLNSAFTRCWTVPLGGVECAANWEPGLMAKKETALLLSRLAHYLQKQEEVLRRSCEELGNRRKDTTQDTHDETKTTASLPKKDEEKNKEESPLDLLPSRQALRLLLIVHQSQHLAICPASPCQPTLHEMGCAAIVRCLYTAAVSAREPFVRMRPFPEVLLRKTGVGGSSYVEKITGKEKSSAHRRVASNSSGKLLSFSSEESTSGALRGECEAPARESLFVLLPLASQTVLRRKLRRALRSCEIRAQCQWLPLSYWSAIAVQRLCC